MRHRQPVSPPFTRPASIKGFTLVEIGIVGILLVLLLSMAVPRFTRAMEQTRVDQAAATLQAIRTAQRLYWLSYRTYADSVETLHEHKLLDEDKTDASNELAFGYSISGADANGFTASATPHNNSRWPGVLTIDQTGVVSGRILASDGTSMTPGWQ